MNTYLFKGHVYLLQFSPINEQFLFLGSFGKNYDKGGLHVMDSSFPPYLVGDAIQSCIYAKV